MNNAIYYVLVIVAGYFCGCIESGYLVGKLCGMDIRDYGSGNSGTTNVLRVLGKTRALLTFLGDALKSFIPVLVVKFLLCPAVPTLNADLIQLVTGFAAVMGHDYPVFLKFKGGKGIATTAASSRKILMMEVEKMKPRRSQRRVPEAAGRCRPAHRSRSSWSKTKI